MDALGFVTAALDVGRFSDVSPTTYIVLMGFGFLTGTAGHIVKSKTVVAAGIFMIFLATIGLPLSYQLSH